MNNLNLVSINNNQVVVSSRQVADNFGKQHKDVLESIRGIWQRKIPPPNSFTKAPLLIVVSSIQNT